MGEIMRAVNKYSETTMSTISRHLQYMKTLNLQSILALLDIHAFIRKCEIISVHKGKFFKNTTEIEIA
jgi:hypothetical protein